MADDEDYDEVEAVVRIPKGGDLADSRRSEGWKRGFTPKSAEKGPEHVEIRLKNENELSPEPEIIYVPEYIDPPSADLTPGQQAAADLVRVVVEGLIDLAKPYVAEWVDTKVIPAMVAKRDHLLQRRRDRKERRKALRAKAPSTTTPDVTSPERQAQPEVAVSDSPKVTVTGAQFEQLFMTWLAREDAQQALWDAIATAEIKDDDHATIALQKRLNELSSVERTDRVRQILSANPSILQDLGRQLLDPQETGQPARHDGSG